MKYILLALLALCVAALALQPVYSASNKDRVKEVKEGKVSPNPEKPKLESERLEQRINAPDKTALRDQNEITKNPFYERPGTPANSSRFDDMRINNPLH